MKRVFLLPIVLSLASLAAAPQISFLVLNPLNWQPGHLPDGWQVKINRGAPEIATVREGRDRYLDLKSHDSSYGLEREVDVDPREAPYLTWKWNVKQLPAGGDFRRSKTDDQAAQVLVAFADRRVLSYIWDSSASAGRHGERQFDSAGAHLRGGLPLRQRGTEPLADRDATTWRATTRRPTDIPLRA